MSLGSGFSPFRSLGGRLGEFLSLGRQPYVAGRVCSGWSRVCAPEYGATMRWRRRWGHPWRPCPPPPVANRARVFLNLAFIVSKLLTPNRVNNT